jgi:hypothetical protein
MLGRDVFERGARRAIPGDAEAELWNPDASLRSDSSERGL